VSIANALQLGGWDDDVGFLNRFQWRGHQVNQSIHVIGGFGTSFGQETTILLRHQAFLMQSLRGCHHLGFGGVSNTDSLR